MQLTTGSNLGHYEILSPLGAGGMGEVYRARDTKLGREVAVKLLLEDVAADPDRLARFEREARLLASLNHVNVATLHGLERDGDTGFLVMELVEGDTLADRIARDPLSAEDAIPIFIEIAEGLEAAHEKGIIHRDLKPANIKLGGDGEPLKILDFGLAKATADETGSGDSSLSMSPTLTLAATQRGEVMGTAAYMSPEQAKGKEVDRRTDVWAFGACLLEALSGKRAFKGEDASELMASVLMMEPRWDALPTTTPPRLRRIIERCLDKDPRRRIRDIGDVLYELEEATSSPQEEPQPATVPSRPGRSPLVPILGAMLAAVVVGLAAWALKPEAASPVIRTSLTTPGSPPLGVQAFLVDVAISPDGGTIVYYTGTGIYARDLGELEGRQLTDSGIGPFVSPDGAWVGYLDQGDVGLKKVSTKGGPSVSIGPVPGFVAGATWGDDDTILFTLGDGRVDMYRVPASGGEPEALDLSVPDGVVDLRFPEFLPGSTAALVMATDTATGTEDAYLAIIDLATLEVRPLIPGAGRGIYVEPGYIVYGIDGTLRAVAFDLDRLELRGDPVPVLDRVLTKRSSGSANFALSRDGTLAYFTGTPLGFAGSTPVWVDRDGRETGVGLEAGEWSYPSVSPDGKRVAVSNLAAERDIWIWDEERKTQTRLTFGDFIDFYPVWEADSQHLLFASNRLGTWNIYRRAADGSGDAELIWADEGNVFPLSITADGRRLVYRRGTSRFDLGILDLEGEPSSLALLETLHGESNAAISPDGHWLAIESNESGRPEIYVRPFPDLDAGRWQVSNSGGIHPVWGPEGRELLYRHVDTGAVMRARIETDSSFRAATPELLFESSAMLGIGRTWDIDPTGERFFTIRTGGTGDETAPHAVLVQNFTSELERLVPAN